MIKEVRIISKLAPFNKGSETHSVSEKRAILTEILEKALTNGAFAAKVFAYEKLLDVEKKILVNIGRTLMEEEKLDVDKMKDEKILKKSYYKSSYKITMPEEEYVRKGYSIKGTDFEANMATLSNGVYNHRTHTYAIEREEIRDLLNNIKIIDNVSYQDGKNLRTYTSIEMLIKKDIEPRINIKKHTAIYRKNPEQFYTDYTNIINEIKAVEKITSEVRKFIKFIGVSSLEQFTKIANKGSKTKGKAEHNIKELVEHKDHAYIIKKYKDTPIMALIEKAKVKIKSEPDASKRVNIKSFITHLGNEYECQFAINYIKDVTFSDMRKKEVREGIAQAIEKIKARLRETGYFGKQGKNWNVVIRNMKDKEYIEDERYEKILKQKDVYDF